MNNLIRLSIFFLLLALTIPSFSNSNKIYVWRDKQGMLVYSDTAINGAEEIEIKTSSMVKSSIDTSFLDITPKIINENYVVNITQPISNSTVRNNTGSVYISANISPVFKPKHKLQLYLNDKLYKQPQRHLMFMLQNIDRGEHKIKITLISDKGKVIATSSPVTFYMHRVSVNKAN